MCVCVGMQKCSGRLHLHVMLCKLDEGGMQQGPIPSSNEMGTIL